MNLRPPDTRRTRGLVLATVAALVAGVVIATVALAGGGAKPPARPLASAVHKALTAPAVPGVSARIRFTNHLVSTGALPQGVGDSPLLSGASGRAWLARDGRFRLELQSENGDDQVVSDGRTLTLYEGKTNTVYTATLPRDRKAKAKRAHKPPTLAEIKRGLARLTRRAAVSGAVPANIAGQPAYQVTVSPKHNGGLLAGLTTAWDAARGVPLRLAVTAKGSDKPVLELAATDIGYGSVPADRFIAPNPPGAKHVKLDLPTQRSRSARHGHARRSEVTGAAAVSRAAGFSVAAPARLAGRARQDVRLVGKGKHAGALVLYGHGLGGLAVLEMPTSAKSGKADRSLRQLPSVSLGGVSGRELSTALGTAVRWTSGGVTYTLVGSIDAATAHTAARGLASP
jgi:outer membrane lipoprotein-sorting protein